MSVSVEQRLEGLTTTLLTGDIHRDVLGVNMLIINNFPLGATVSTGTEVSSASLDFRLDLLLNSRSFKTPESQHRRAKVGTGLRG